MDGLVIGIDGGGTKTRAWLALRDGTVVGCAEVGASNVFAHGVARAARVLAEVVASVMADARMAEPDRRRIDCVYAGVAGAGTAETRDSLVQALAGAAGLKEDICRVDHDLSIALEGALEGRPGMIVLAGTGSAAFGRTRRGRTWRAGGWGPLLDDVGGGHWLGFEAMKAVVRAADGRVETSRFVNQVLEHLKLPGPRELVTALRGGEVDPSRISGLAPVVLAAVARGDPAAVEIAARGARELASLASAVVRRLGKDVSAPLAEIAFVGGLLGAGGDYLRMLEEALVAELPAVERRDPALPPVGGAVSLATKQLGTPLDGQGWARLRKSSGGRVAPA